MATEEKEERVEDEKRGVGRSDVALTGEIGLSASQGYTTPPFPVQCLCVCPHLRDH